MTGRRVVALGAIFLVGLLGFVFLEKKSNQRSTETKSARFFSSSRSTDRKPASLPPKNTDKKSDNKDEAPELQNFLDDGWQVVTAEEPRNDELLANPNPSDEEQRQALSTLLQSAVFDSTDLETLSHIARNTDDQKIRFVAVEALARIADEKTETALAALFEEVDSDETRSQIISNFEPSDSHSIGTRFLVSLINRPSLSETLKEQALNSLIGVTLTDESAYYNIKSSLPQAWSDKLTEALDQLHLRPRREDT